MTLSIRGRARDSDCLLYYIGRVDRNPGLRVSPMTIRLSIDRFEGPRRSIAVLLTEDGRSILFPRDLLPRGAKAGELLTMDLARDLEGTAEVARQARGLRQELDKTDPGGDIRL
jgi:Protein of unknown function (DUF3006)